MRVYESVLCPTKRITTPHLPASQPKKKKNSKCALTYASAQSTQATRIRRRTLGSSKINKKNLLPQKKKNNKDNLYYHCEMKQNHDRIGHTKKKKNEQQRTENKGRQRKKKSSKMEKKDGSGNPNGLKQVSWCKRRACETSF